MGKGVIDPMRIAILSAVVAAVVLAAGHSAEAGVKISVNLGGGYYCPPPVVVAPAPCPPLVVYHPPVSYYYYPAPLVVTPAPVVVRPAPVVVYPDAYWHHRVVRRDGACGSALVTYPFR
jgi:hypothetical protein